MSFFKKISFVQFRNYAATSFRFDKKIVGICGANGTGKTNLLDAVYYLCFTKSYFSKPDIKSAMHGTQGFRIDGIAELKNNDYTITCIVHENGRKEFLVDEDVVKKFSSHIGRFSCVMIAPDDAALITGSSEERRRFLDTILSQIYPDYLQRLIDYNKILLQRNSLLKTMYEQQKQQDDLLDVLDEQLSNAGKDIFFRRKDFAETLVPSIVRQYEDIAGKDENIAVNYQSQLFTKDYLQLLKENRQKDLYAQRTNFGIHKDDLVLLLNNEPFKQLASQGQRKSLLFAMKLAEFFALKEAKNNAPVLLLDDVFEKLDQNRMLNLLRKVCTQTDAQIFITDTHKHRLQEAFSELELDGQLVEL